MHTWLSYLLPCNNLLLKLNGLKQQSFYCLSQFCGLTGAQLDDSSVGHCWVCRAAVVAVTGAGTSMLLSSHFWLLGGGVSKAGTCLSLHTNILGFCIAW